MRISSRLLSLSTHPKQPNRLPFPFPDLHIGTDICHISRVHKLITKDSAKYYKPFKSKLFHPQELLYNQSRLERYELAEDTDALARFLAGRFALKEAAVKACPWEKLQLSSVLVMKGQNDSLSVTIVPGDGGRELEARGSLSHDGDYATAVVMAARPDQATD